ncbi:XRE family transcriptional regulator [Brachybacterium phenoliresistens]|uniref:XRE family transcriptional regulator n=1 Tax=Brachybacterium phenoliresistens TaxID=396014 RepID=Z9JTA7_9MICO|nr:helix-turn-helix transcriptional regulator [Brachybacterium phenoliresistens]EWS81590.1 XRE family transcriptional regulator [Brachybacterium phenoliresistens]
MERSGPAPLAPLLRELIGQALREERHAQGRTLADVAARSGVSMQHLSEVERGLKDPSSEVLAAVLGALGLSAWDLPALLAPRPVLLDLTADGPDELDARRHRSITAGHSASGTRGVSLLAA